MDKLLRGIALINFYVGACAFLLMCAVIFLQVIARYVFNNALPWPEELGRYLFLVCAWASICLCVEKRTHLQVDILPLCLPKFAGPLSLVSMLATACFFAISCWLVWEMLGRLWKMGTKALTMPIPMWTLWACILLFCLFSFLAAFGQLIRAIRFRSTSTTMGT